MDTITQDESARATSAPQSLAQTLIHSLRTISAERAAETAALIAERDSYRELLLAAMSEMAALNTQVDRERSSRLWLLSQYRALRDGRGAGDARLDATDDAIVPVRVAA